MAKITKAHGSETKQIEGLLQDTEKGNEMLSALIRSEANLTSLINNRNESIWSIDQDYNYVILNDYFRNAYKDNYGIELMEGMNALTPLTPELKDIWSIHYKNAFAGERINFEFSNQLNGRKQYHLVYLNPIITKEEIVGVSGVSVDVTKRKETEKTLIDSRANMQAIIENTTDSIWAINTSYEILYANEVFTSAFFLSFGVQVGEGINLLESLPESLQPLWKPRYDRGLNNEQFQFVDTVDTEYGTIHIEVSVNPIVSEGKVIGAALFGSDITERKREELEKLNFEKQILQTQKLESLGVLAGGIAHDFNNILMGILGYADLALSSLDSISPAREFVQGISASSKQAADLVKQMLAYSGKGKFSQEPIDLNHLLTDTFQMLKISVSKNAVLRFNLSKEPVFIEGDPSQIRQVVMNMVINASDAVGRNSGVIAITTGSMYCDREYIQSTGFEAQTTISEKIEEGMYAILEISDTGVGIARDDLSRIFEPFYTTKFTGRGLGLSAVLGIVNGHHGMIKIYTEEGKGTTFKVLLPLHKKEDEMDTISKSAMPKKDSWRATGKFLIADDEEAVRSVGGHMVKKLGFEVLTANDGRQAIEVYKKHMDEIVCVLLDLTMPHKDGAEVFRALRNLNPDVRVILSSGYNEQDATQQFVGKGLAGFIQKPYSTSDLLEKIREVMEPTEKNT